MELVNFASTWEQFIKKTQKKKGGAILAPPLFGI